MDRALADFESAGDLCRAQVFPIGEEHDRSLPETESGYRIEHLGSYLGKTGSTQLYSRSDLPGATTNSLAMIALGLIEDSAV